MLYILYCNYSEYYLQYINLIHYYFPYLNAELQSEVLVCKIKFLGVDLG